MPPPNITLKNDAIIAAPSILTGIGYGFSFSISLRISIPDSTDRSVVVNSLEKLLILEILFRSVDAPCIRLINV